MRHKARCCSEERAEAERKRKKERGKNLLTTICSEDHYVQSLNDLLLTYLVPMRKLGIATPASLERVFLNVEDIATIHRNLQKALADASGSDGEMVRIAKVFRGHADKLRLYSVYVSGFEPAAEELLRWQEDPIINSFLEEKKAGGALPLGALLIQPVQRICRYPLLFGEVLKNTPPSDSDRAIIEDTQESLEHVTQWINEEKRKQFNVQRMTLLVALIEDLPPDIELYVPGRKHVSEGMYRVSDSVAMENLPLFKVIIFNDILLWVRPNKRSDTLRYEGHICFDRSTRTERIGLDIVRIETLENSFILQAKDLVTTEHLYSVLFEAVKLRTHTLNAIHNKRVASAQNERERLKAQVETMELQLSQTKRIMQAQESKISTLIELVESLSLKLGQEVPNSVRAPPELIITPTIPSPSDVPQQGTPVLRPRRIQLSPKMAQLPTIAAGAKVQPFVVIADQDFLTDDPDELSFSFGELILVTEDNGDHFRGRPLEGEVFSERKVYQRHVSLMAKRGNLYVRIGPAMGPQRKLSSNGSGERGPTAAGGAPGSGSFLRDLGSRASFTRAHVQENRKSIRTIADTSSSNASSPAFRKKTDRTSSRPALKESGERHSESVDHSQEVILKQGWLRKIGGTRKTWKRRFFFLSESLLYYYENDKIAGKKPLGAIVLKELLHVERSKKHEDGFQLPFNDRLWEFRADSEAEAAGWMEAIQSTLPTLIGSRAGKVINPIFGSPKPGRRSHRRTASDSPSPRRGDMTKSPSIPDQLSSSPMPSSTGDESESISVVEDEKLESSLASAYFYDL